MHENYAKNQCADKAVEGGYAAMQGVGITQMGACARQSSKGVLRDKVRQLRMEADRLEALAGALPEKLPHEADEALWSLLLGR